MLKATPNVLAISVDSESRMGSKTPLETLPRNNMSSAWPGLAGKDLVQCYEGHNLTLSGSVELQIVVIFLIF